MIRAMYDSRRLIGRFAQDDSHKNGDDSCTDGDDSREIFCNVLVEVFVNYTIMLLRGPTIWKLGHVTVTPSHAHLGVIL